MTKYYQVIKDHPYWKVGAIISTEADKDEEEKDKMYIAIEDIWNKFEDKNYEEYPNVVENSKTFFKRVYKSSLDKHLFVTGEKLRKAYAALIK